MDTLLRAATGAASEVVAESNAKTKFDPAEFEERVLERARLVAQEETGLRREAELRTRRTREALQSARERQRQPLSRKDQQAVTRLSTALNGEEAAAAEQIFRSLSPGAITELGVLRNDAISSRQNRMFVGLFRPRDDPLVQELKGKGLVQQGEPDADGDTLVTLTPEGEQVARLFASDGGSAGSATS